MSFLKKINSKCNLKTRLLCLIAAMIPFTINIGNMAIILASVFALFTFKMKNIKKLKFFGAFFPVLFFLIVLISSLFSKNQVEAFRHLDLVLLLVCFVLVIINQNITEQVILKVLKWFFYTCTFSTLILLINNLIKVLKNKGIDELIFHKFTLLYDYHPVYFSINLSLALFYILNTKKEQLFFKSKILKGTCIMILILGLIFCSSKAILFINAIIYLLYCFIKIKQYRKRIVYIIFLIVAIIGVYNITFIKERFVDGLRFSNNIIAFKPTNDFANKKIFTYKEKTNLSDLELRYVLNSIGIYHLIHDNKAWFGYKQGDTQSYLDYYYFSYNLAPNWYEGSNLHNQFSHILVTYGIFVLLFFLGYLIFSWYKAIKHLNSFHIFFLTVVCFGFLFEVNLVRSKGIIFFYFFNTLFLFNYFDIKNSNIRHKRNT